MARPRPRITRDPNIEFIDDKSGPRMVHYGARFREVMLPRGTRVIYPNKPVEPLANPKAAIKYALNHPHEADPLYAQLRPGMKLTIAIDDISLPLPPMQRPDLRELILTEILELCAQVVRIPMLGIKGSLNVAVAFGVAAYAIRFGLREG